MEKLLKAVECSLAASQAARETVEEILKRGADTAIFFAGAADHPKTPQGAEIQLTPQDREFLRTLSIRPDSP
ncbi:MAG: hypothetical protein HYY64_11110 [Candidatus Rokubacteria bacterium]|nr:hypothetical protein [Candidatus Rokubacteria bacterium]